MLEAVANIFIALLAFALVCLLFPFLRQFVATVIQGIRTDFRAGRVRRKEKPSAEIKPTIVTLPERPLCHTRRHTYRPLRFREQRSRRAGPLGLLFAPSSNRASRN